MLRKMSETAECVRRIIECGTCGSVVGLFQHYKESDGFVIDKEEA